MAKKATARMNWFDEHTQEPLIEQYARQLDSFLQTMADGKVEESEIRAQEARLIKLMKDVEPRLDDALHATITALLCQLTAYDLMQTLYMMQQARPKTKLKL